MKKIKLTQGKYALVDDEDFESLNQYKWYTAKGINTFYAKRYIRIKNKGIVIPMASEVLGNKPKNKNEVDHIDGNGLNNRKYNLRWSTRSENARNVGIKKNNTSSYKCVYPVTGSRSWQVYVTYKGKKIYLGSFKDKKLAAREYNKFAQKHYKNFAKLNII